MELQSERQARKNDETDKSHLQACLNHFKLVLVEELNENDELKRQRDMILLKEDIILRKRHALKKLYWGLNLKYERETSVTYPCCIR